LRAKSFEELKLPLYACATDINEGKSVYFYQGEIIKKIIASASIPVLFGPIEIDGRQYVDGGVLNNLPITPLYDKCEKIIGVHVNPIGYNENYRGLISIAERCFQLSINKNVYVKSQRCDLFIDPKGLVNYHVFDSSKSAEIFEIGYAEAISLLEKKADVITG
jgi:NTE family protein